MKIFDCTTYFEEDLMMDVRFNILDKYVDTFIVCESKYSHSGKEKKINFDLNNFPKFKNKIKHIINCNIMQLYLVFTLNPLNNYAIIPYLK